MKCKKLVQYYDDFVLGELKPEEEMLVNNHIQECPACRMEIDGLEKMIAGFREAGALTPRPCVLRKIKGRLKAPHSAGRFLNAFPTRFAYALAAFILGMILMRTADVFLVKRVVETKEDMLQIEPLKKELLADSIYFHAAPAKNLARI